jgi:hypothetical protein
MLTLQIPTLLALLGTALMAVVIFAPAPADAKVTMSLAPPFAPPPAPSPLERWNSREPAQLDAWSSPPGNSFAWPAFDAPALHEFAIHDGDTDTQAREPAHDDMHAGTDADRDVSNPAPAWPALVDARAASCDASARLALVDALATVCAPWADAILHRALDDEPDALVHDAIVAALRAAAGR